MNNYEKSLLKFYIIAIHDVIIYNKLSKTDKKKFSDYRYKLKNGISPTEEHMRKIVEKYLHKEILIINAEKQSKKD